MIAIQVIEERFREIHGGQSAFQGAMNGSPRDTRTVRRPIRGITIKEDTYATMRVVTGDGKSIALTDAGGSLGTQSSRKTNNYSNFLLQQVSEDRMEKQQILETFGEPYIFLFGERARMVTFAGILINTFDFNWEAEWWENYDLYLRGTKCVENDSRVFLAYDETLISGYIIASNAAKNSQDKNHVNFQFTMFLTGYTTFSDIGNGTAVPLRARERAAKASGAVGSQQFEYNVQGPDKLLPGEVLTGQVSFGEVKAPSLVEGLSKGVSAVVNTWNKAQTIVNTAVHRLSELARGDILRVPYGFSGAMAYDESDMVRVQESPGTLGSYGVVKYSEFNQNKDEFIGASSHYGSSLTSGHLSSLPSHLRNQQLVNQARLAWIQAGFDIPDDTLAAVSSFVIKNGVGLLAAGSTAAWQVADKADTGLSPLSVDPLTAVRSNSVVPVL